MAGGRVGRPLATVTSVAADACGLTGRKGRLLPGHDADVNAVAGDPDSRPVALLDVRAVFRAGRRVV
jgi:imidazolonepropionase-like amidohydrolase